MTLCREVGLRDADAAASSCQVRAAAADWEVAGPARLQGCVSTVQRRRTKAVSAGDRQRPRRPRLSIGQTHAAFQI